MASFEHRTIFDPPTAAEKQQTASPLYDGAEAMQTRLYRPLASVTNGNLGPASGTNVSFAFESTDTLQWVPGRTFLQAKITSRCPGADGAGTPHVAETRYVSMPIAQLFSQATLRLNSYTVHSVQEPGMIAQFNARTTLKDREKANVLSAAGFNISNEWDNALRAHTIAETGQQFVQPLSLIFGLCQTEYALPHCRVEMDFVIAPDLGHRLMVSNELARAGLGENVAANLRISVDEIGLITTFARPAVPRMPVSTTLVWEMPEQQFHSHLVSDNNTDIQLGVAASTYKLQVGFRRTGTSTDQDACAFIQDQQINQGNGVRREGQAGDGYLSSVQVRLGSCTSPNAQFSMVGAVPAERESTAKRAFFESQMANGVLTGEVDGEAFSAWNGSSIYSLPIVREPESRDTAAVLAVRFAGAGINQNQTQAAIVTTGRSILTMRYGELGEEAIVESSNYV